MMRAYAELQGACRREFLLSYFGEATEGPCGHCDLCDAGLVHGAKALAMTAAAIAIRAVLLLIIAFPRLFIANLFSFRWPVGSRNAGHPLYDVSPELGPPRHPISDYKPTFSQEIIST